MSASFIKQEPIDFDDQSEHVNSTTSQESSTLNCIEEIFQSELHFLNNLNQNVLCFISLMAKKILEISGLKKIFFATSSETLLRSITNKNDSL